MEFGKIIEALKAGMYQFIIMTTQADLMDKYLGVLDERLIDLTSDK